MIRIHCNACHRPILVDESKLPMREVIFPCPACKAALTVDRRNLSQAAAAAPSPVQSAPAPPAAAPQKPAASPASPLPPQASAPPPDEDSQAILEDDLAAKALIVGVDSPAARQAAETLGFQPVHFATVEACRDYYLQEYPSLVFLCPAQMTRRRSRSLRRSRTSAHRTAAAAFSSSWPTACARSTATRPSSTT